MTDKEKLPLNWGGRGSEKSESSGQQIAFCLNRQIRGTFAAYQRFAVLDGVYEELENCCAFSRS